MSVVDEIARVVFITKTLATFAWKLFHRPTIGFESWRTFSLQIDKAIVFVTKSAYDRPVGRWK